MGSEMCIRDRISSLPEGAGSIPAGVQVQHHSGSNEAEEDPFGQIRSGVRQVDSGDRQPQATGSSSNRSTSTRQTGPSRISAVEVPTPREVVHGTLTPAPPLHPGPETGPGLPYLRESCSNNTRAQQDPAGTTKLTSHQSFQADGTADRGDSNEPDSTTRGSRRGHGGRQRHGSPCPRRTGHKPSRALHPARRSHQGLSLIHI